MNVKDFLRNKDSDDKIDVMMTKILSKIHDDNWASGYKQWVNVDLKPYLDDKGLHMEDGHLDRRKRNKFIKSLEKQILQRDMNVPKTRELNARLREHMWYKGKEIKFDDLREDFKEQDFKLKPEGDLDEIYDIFSDARQLLDGPNQQRLNNLKRALSSRAKQRDVETKEISTLALKRLSREIGEFDLGDFEDRKIVYDYWERVSKEFEPFNAAKEKFIEAAKKYRGKDFDPDGIIKAMDSLDLEDYIGKFSTADFNIDIPDNWDKAVIIIKRYSLIQGQTFKIKESVGEHPQETPVKTGASRDVQLAGKEMDPTAGLDVKGIEDIVDSMSEGVDPLLYYDLLEGGFENIKPKLSDIAEVKKHIKEILKIKGTGVDPETKAQIETAYFPESELEQFENWFADVIEDVRDIHEAGSIDKFHLPYSQFTISENKKGSNVISKYEKFMGLLSEMVEDEKMSFASYSRNFSEDLKDTEVGLKEGKGKDYSGAKNAREATKALWANIKNIKGRMLNEPFTGTGKNMPNELDELWLKLLEATNEYISIPLTSEFMVEKELPVWIQKLPNRVIEIENALNNPLGAFLKNTQRRTDDKGKTTGNVGFGALEAQHIDDIITFIELIRNPNEKFDITKVYEEAEDAVDALDAMWGESFHNVNVESIGGIVHKYADVSGFDEELPDFMGKSIKALFENYSFPRELDVRHKRYPILLLRSVLQMPPFKAYPNYFLGDLGPKLKELQDVFDDFAANVRTSETNFKLLNAHDTIRKMNGQKVIWAMLSLNEISHMDNVINKVEKEYRVGITATEIDSIVKSVSSYNSLAKNHGVNEEVVYTVKAMFR